MTLEELGLNARYLVAGFAGGVVHAIVFKAREPIPVIGSVVAGMLTANYLAPAVVHYFGNWLGEGGSAFAVGLTARAVCQGVVALVSARLRNVVAAENRETPP